MLPANNIAAKKVKSSVDSTDESMQDDPLWSPRSGRHGACPYKYLRLNHYLLLNHLRAGRLKIATKSVP